MKWRPATWTIVTLVRAYKVTLSPLFTGCCRFSPSCSTYCIEAVETHGPLRGGWLALRRLLRCHPFGPSGYDPVPGRIGKGQGGKKKKK